MRTALLVLMLAFAPGCDGKLPIAPTPAPSPATTAAPVTPPSAVVRVTNVSPQLGSSAGATRVLINGHGFAPGATVILGGSETSATVLSSIALTAMTPPHATGLVDVVIINPSGQRGTLARGFTYADIGDGRRPVITGVSPESGTPGGGSYIAITGSGFEPGAIARLGEIPLRTYPFLSNSTRLNAESAPQAPGVVDVVVLNPDGQEARLAGGYRYAPPGSLNFNGSWQGSAAVQTDNDGTADIGFTIENNWLIMVSCNSETRLLSPPRPITGDGFLILENEQVLIAGTFQSAAEARGSMAFAPCGPTWSAVRR